MGKIKGFMQYNRMNESSISPKKRINNYREFTISPKPSELQKQGARCMDCGVPFCHSGCPLGNLIPDFIIDGLSDLFLPSGKILK